MTLSWSIVLQSDFIMPIYTSLQYFYIISPVFQKIFFMNTIIDLNSPCVISWMEKPKDFVVGLELHHYVTCKAPQHLRITLVICHAQLFSEDRSIDSFVPMTYLFFLSISRIWNWLGDQIFKQTLNVIKLISMPCIYFLFFNLINIRIGWRCCFRSFWEYFHSSEQSGGSSCQHLQCCRPQVDGTSEWSRGCRDLDATP